MEDGEFKDLKKRWLKYKMTHEKSLDTSVYELFSSFVIPTVKKYCEKNECVTYQSTITEEGASVIIKSKRLLFCDEDSEILKLILKASLVKIQSTGDFVSMELWYRSWKWKKR
ncbi:MAG: hypothetical protein LUH21_25885 [Clostridiales bacterium]|nr:hypothetical protein [Clostridiales bacterium]